MPGRYTHAAALAKARELRQGGQQAFVWIGLHEPDEPDAVVAELFGLHELAVEDAVHAHQRPKMDRYDNSLFLVLKTVSYVEHEPVALAREIVETGEIMVFLGRRLHRHRPARRPHRLAGVRSEMEADPSSWRLGPSRSCTRSPTGSSTRYLTSSRRSRTTSTTMENAVFPTDATVDIEQIYLLKREIVGLRRAVAPLSVALQPAQLRATRTC